MFRTFLIMILMPRDSPMVLVWSQGFQKGAICQDSTTESKLTHPKSLIPVFYEMPCMSGEMAHMSSFVNTLVTFIPHYFMYGAHVKQKITVCSKPIIALITDKSSTFPLSHLRRHCPGLCSLNLSPVIVVFVLNVVMYSGGVG